MLEFFVFWVVLIAGALLGAAVTAVAYTRNDILANRRKPGPTPRISTLDLFEMPEALRNSSSSKSEN